eukprot:SAG31_NODE_19480_length_600_cov_1.461078_1_plen_200_part_11
MQQFGWRIRNTAMQDLLNMLQPATVSPEGAPQPGQKQTSFGATVSKSALQQLSEHIDRVIENVVTKAQDVAADDGLVNVLHGLSTLAGAASQSNAAEAYTLDAVQSMLDWRSSQLQRGQLRTANVNDAIEAVFCVAVVQLLAHSVHPGASVSCEIRGLTNTALNTRIFCSNEGLDPKTYLQLEERCLAHLSGHVSLSNYG